MTTQERIDKQVNDLREMESSLRGLEVTMLQLIRERDLYKDQNQRLQLEVARLRMASSEAVHALTRVSKLNPNCAEIGAGMLATIVSESQAALAKLEGTR